MTASLAEARDTNFFTDEALQAFARDGFIVVRGLFSGAALDRLIAEVAALEALPEVPGRHMVYYEDSVDAPIRRVLSRIEYFVDYQPGLGALTRSDALLGRVSALFGEPAVLFKEKVNFKMPGGRGFEPHQDMQAGWQAFGDLQITAMVSIDRADEGNGCLELASGHHKRGLLGDLWKPLTDEQLQGVTFEKLPTEPGDAIFFDSYAPHRSAPNLSGQSRRILYITYGRAADGDSRERYFAAKRRNLPPDIERDPDKTYEYKV